jgi:hypothetical protein
VEVAEGVAVAVIYTSMHSGRARTCVETAEAGLGLRAMRDTGIAATLS